jgi:hypothetical protein
MFSTTSCPARKSATASIVSRNRQSHSAPKVSRTIPAGIFGRHTGHWNPLTAPVMVSAAADWSAVTEADIAHALTVCVAGKLETRSAVDAERIGRMAIRRAKHIAKTRSIIHGHACDAAELKIAASW